MDDDLSNEAESLIDEHDVAARKHTGYIKWVTGIVAVAWSVFQLLLPQFLLLNSFYVRAIHLCFALTLVFLSSPALKRLKPARLKFLWCNDRLPAFDVILALIAACCTLYMVVNYENIAMRMGNANTLDLVMGGTLIVILLEATRRALGWPLAVLALLFMLYCNFAQSPLLPEAMQFRARSVDYITQKLAIGSEGIFGVPLDVSANIVFLFVLFGSMLEKCGGGEFFVNLAYSLLGRYRGGPAKAAILSSGLTGMISGSSIANTVTTGMFTIPLMKKSGYPPEKAAAIEVAASTNGQLMPPIMGAAAFIIAEYCNITYFEVLRAAFIPAVISYIALIYIAHLEACKLGLKGMPKDALPQFFTTLKSGLHFLLPIAIMLYELIIQRHSPELAAFRAIIILSILILLHNSYKAILVDRTGCIQGLKDTGLQLLSSLASGARNMITIGIAVAAAGIIVGSVTMGSGQLIVDAVDSFAQNSIVAILLLSGVASLILGMGLPTTATYIVMASLTAGIITQLAAGAGIVLPILAAHLFVFYFGILADDTPPVGLAAYAASAIARSNPLRTGVQGFMYDLRTAVLPFMFVFNTEFLLMKYDGQEWTNITDISYIAYIFISGLLTMALFAVITQRFCLTRIAWHQYVYEIPLLLIPAIIFAWPEYLMRHFSELGRTQWNLVAVVMIILFIASQLMWQKFRTARSAQEGA